MALFFNLHVCVYLFLCSFVPCVPTSTLRIQDFTLPPSQSSSLVLFVFCLILLKYS